MDEKFGFELGRAFSGMSDAEFTKGAAFLDTIYDDLDGAYQKKMAALAVDIYSAAGQFITPACQLFVKLANHEGPWVDSFNGITGAFYAGLAEAEMTKQAADDVKGGLQYLVDTLRGVAKASPEAYALAGLAGGGLGLAGWHLKQSEADNDAELAAMEAQRDHLNRMTDEITHKVNRQLERRGLLRAV